MRPYRPDELKLASNFSEFSAAVVPDTEPTTPVHWSPSSSSFGCSCCTGSKAACFGRIVLRECLTTTNTHCKCVYLWLCISMLPSMYNNCTLSTSNLYSQCIFTISIHDRSLIPSQSAAVYKYSDMFLAPSASVTE